jgi:hypothetical protein
VSQETSNHSFDELTRGLVSGTLSRGKALRLMGAALVGGTLASLGMGGEAAADPPGCKRTGKHCTRDTQCCGTLVCDSGTCAAACESGQVLCNGNCVSDSCLANSGQVFNTSTCQCECPTGRVKLSNGTCAKPCPNGDDDCGGFPCGCFNIAGEGPFCATTSRGNICDFDLPGFCGTGELCSVGLCFPAC